MDAKQQWLIIKGVMDKLPEPPYHLTSNSTPDGGRAGVTMQVGTRQHPGTPGDYNDRKQAATLLVAGSHRLATPAEIATMIAADEEAVKYYAGMEAKNKQQMAMTPQLEKLVEAALSGLPQQKKEKEK